MRQIGDRTLRRVGPAGRPRSSRGASRSSTPSRICAPRGQDRGSEPARVALGWATSRRTLRPNPKRCRRRRSADGDRDRHDHHDAPLAALLVEIIVRRSRRASRVDPLLRRRALVVQPPVVYFPALPGVTVYYTLVPKLSRNQSRLRHRKHDRRRLGIASRRPSSCSRHHVYLDHPEQLHARNNLGRSDAAEQRSRFVDPLALSLFARHDDLVPIRSRRSSRHSSRVSSRG